MQTTLKLHAPAYTAWKSLTPLAQNEWICWVISVKKEETRKEHLKRLIEDLKKGKRRPCCFIGCTHRTDKAMSPSRKGILQTAARSRSSKS